MKRKTIHYIRYSIIVMIAIVVGLIITRAVTVSAEADEQLKQIDNFLMKHAGVPEAELETVSLSYSDWQISQNDVLSSEFEDNSHISDSNRQNPENEELDIYAMDVWELGWELYGIPYQDTTRSLILISHEGYGPESALSYYVACACWTRCTNDYLCIGAGDLFTSFGGADTWNYGLWMDEYGWDSYAEDALREAYLNPTYVVGCNGVDQPESWIFEEDGIYVW